MHPLDQMYQRQRDIAFQKAVKRRNVKWIPKGDTFANPVPYPPHHPLGNGPFHPQNSSKQTVPSSFPLKRGMETNSQFRHHDTWNSNSNYNKIPHRDLRHRDQDAMERKAMVPTIFHPHQIQEANDIIHTLQGMVRTACRCVKTVRSEKEAVELHRVELEREMDSFNAEYKTLRDERCHKDRVIDDLETRICDMECVSRTQEAHLQIEIKKMRLKMSSLQDELQRVNEENEQMAGAVQREKEMQRVSMNQASEMIVALEQELQYTKDVVKRLQSKMKGTNERLSVRKTHPKVKHFIGEQQVLSVKDPSINPQRNHRDKIQEIENEANDNNSAVSWCNADDEMEEGELVYSDSSIDVIQYQRDFDNNHDHKDVREDGAIDRLNEEREIHRKKLTETRNKIEKLRIQLNQNP